jgi:hypothetical protein
MGMAFLRAWEVTGDAQYLDAAKAAADALAIGQLESGGWDYLIDFDPAQSVRWYRRSDAGRVAPAEAAKRRNISTFDDDNTQSALRLLVAVAEASRGADEPRDRRIREARDYGLRKLLEAQRPNGGWPQRWSGVPADPAAHPVRPARFPAAYPREYPKENYMGFYTLNDNTHRDCVMTLLDAAKRMGRPEFRAAALRGGATSCCWRSCRSRSRRGRSSTIRSWSRRGRGPLSRRACAANESVGVMRLLVDLYLETGDGKYLAPLPRAIAWFRRSEVAPGVWARMYELQTNRPVYGDRDGKINYRLEELSEERRTGYSWQGEYGVPGAMALLRGGEGGGARGDPGETAGGRGEGEDRGGPGVAREGAGAAGAEHPRRARCAGALAGLRRAAHAGRADHDECVSDEPAHALRLRRSDEVSSRRGAHPRWLPATRRDASSTPASRGRATARFRPRRP